MTRITPLNPALATGKAKQLLDGVHAKLGMTPNLMATLANAPAALEGYLNFNGALGSGGALLDAKFREQIALTVAQENSCEYCLSAHSLLGKMAGLKPDEIAASRNSHSSDTKRQAGLKFAQAIVAERGNVSDAELDEVRRAGYSDGEITEIVAHVALNIFTNYFNHVAGTDVDFPRVPVSLTQTA
jgi:uncharacterized peroxidase-related enzyme